MNIRSYIRYEIGDKINETARVISLKRNVVENVN